MKEPRHSCLKVGIILTRTQASQKVDTKGALISQQKALMSVVQVAALPVAFGPNKLAAVIVGYIGICVDPGIRN